MAVFIEKLLSYLKSQFKDTAIIILLVGIVKLWARNEDLTTRCLDLQQKTIEEMGRQMIQARVDTKEAKDFAKSYQDLYLTVQGVNNEKGNWHTNSRTNDSPSLFNPERKQGY